MPARNPLRDKKDFFGDDDVTHEDVNFHLKVDGLREKEGRVVARPIPIINIWADPSQPRRAIPAQIRKSWNGNPVKVPDLILEWVRILKMSQRVDLKWIETLKGNHDLDIDRERMSPLLGGLVSLIDLAMNIRDKGLNNPITVTRQGDGEYLLHTGERRWLAHHLLRIALGGEYEKVAAIERPYDVWTQVAENTQRSEMNAIAMCRSLAKLIMAMYAGEVDFQPYEKLVQADGNDQAFYKQVLDLNIKHGMAEQVLNALNTSSRGYISNYRNLLKLPPTVWMIADERNYAEGYLRQILRLEYPVDQIRAAQENWSLDQIAAAIQRDEPSKVFTIVNTFEDGDDEEEQEKVFTTVNTFGEKEAPAHSATLEDNPWYEVVSDDEDEPPVQPAWGTEGRYEETLEDDEDWAEDVPSVPFATQDGSVWLIDALMQVAKAYCPPATRALKNLRDRRYEDIAIWIKDNPGASYQDKLAEEGELIDQELLRQAISGRIWKLLNSMLAAAQEIGNGDGSQ